MERSVVVGGSLISVSLLLAVMLNSYASRDATKLGAASLAQPSAAGASLDPPRQTGTPLANGEPNAADEAEVSAAPLPEGAVKTRALRAH